MQLDAAEVIASGMAEVEEVLRRGFRSRKTEGTLCNERSSRSHVVLTVSIDGGSCAAGGRLVLVDLAGSENVQRSGADEGGQLLAEARAINRSLSALGDVIEATAKQQAFVPYRNSRLTMLLEEPLTASKVLLLAHVSPMVRDATDTAHSLQFAGHVRGLDFGAQRMRLEQEEQQRAAHRSQQEARQSQQEAQRYQLEAKQLQGQLEQSRKEQSEAQKFQQELRQQVASLTDQLRDSRRELGKEQALRMRAESGTPRGPQYQRHGSTGSIHGPASQSLGSSPPPPSRLMVPQRRPGTPGANGRDSRDSWRTWTDAPDSEGPAPAPARRSRPERSPLGDRTNQEACRAGLGKEFSGAKPPPAEIIGLPKDIVDLKLGKDDEDDIATPRADPPALAPALSPESSPLRHGGAPVASPQRSPVPSPPFQERTVIGLVERGPDSSPRSSRSPTGSDAGALSSARRRLSVLEQGDAERCSARFNLYDGVQVRSALRQHPTDFKAKLLSRHALGPSGTRRECRRVAFAEQQPEPRSPPKWYLEMLEYKIVDDPQPAASTAATGSSPRSPTPPIRRSPRDSASMRHSSDAPARWR